ncbi:hypothetical protein MMC09_006054 [Bachmanniomyces sp. S44760]|nr:hypothetical protein [Bachmanniomyces sp. S44760]
MFNSVSILFSPVILIVSIPLTYFAIVTTSLAFSTLLIRVLMVYIELAISIIQNQFSSPSISTPPSSPTSTKTSLPTKSRQGSLRRSSTSSSSKTTSSGTLTPRTLEAPWNNTQSFYNLASPNPNRDYEGVGGWRIESSDEPNDPDNLYTSLTPRLELPATASPILANSSAPVVPTDPKKRKHRRSLTSGARPMSTTAAERPRSLYSEPQSQPQSHSQQAQTQQLPPVSTNRRLIKESQPASILRHSTNSDKSTPSTPSGKSTPTPNRSPVRTRPRTPGPGPIAQGQADTTGRRNSLADRDPDAAPSSSSSSSTGVVAGPITSRNPTPIYEQYRSSSKPVQESPKPTNTRTESRRAVPPPVPPKSPSKPKMNPLSTRNKSKSTTTLNIGSEAGSVRMAKNTGPGSKKRRMAGMDDENDANMEIKS